MPLIQIYFEKALLTLVGVLPKGLSQRVIMSLHFLWFVLTPLLHAWTADSPARHKEQASREVMHATPCSVNRRQPNIKYESFKIYCT